MSFLSWIPEPTNINQWSYLCLNKNPKAIQFLEQNLKNNIEINLENNLGWYWLSQNPSAINLLMKNPEKINWYWLSQNPNAMDILKKNPEKINWHSLSMNPNAIHLLEKNPDKIAWDLLSQNPNAIHILEQTLSSHSSTLEFSVQASSSTPSLLQNYQKQYKI